MKVILTYIHDDGILTEEVETIEPGADLFCGEHFAINMADVVQPGWTAFEDEWGLFCVRNEHILSIENKSPDK